ncbi:MAG TPA: hypothetical protein VG737_04485, partial [Cyclobacteriaceae bacterium]|nr:hypothetical protein [Cyclobacteriaceae bacterium]
MKIKVIFFLCASIATQAQIGARVQQQGKIHGLWQNSEFGYDMTLILNQDGSGEFDGEAIRFTEKGNILAIISGDKTTNYTFSLKGDAMTLSGGDLDKPITFSRKGKEAVTQGTGAQPSEAAFSATDKKLFGLWSGNGEMIEFKPDGNCVYLGNTFPYKVSQG